METLSKAACPPPPFVAFSGVRKTYDGRSLIVKDLNLAIAKGEFLTLLGPSGSGKTTCLMMLAGFESPTEGSISLDGVRLNQLPPHKRNIGMVFQNYALFPHLTVAENIGYALSCRGWSRQRKRTRRRRKPRSSSRTSRRYAPTWPI